MVYHTPVLLEESIEGLNIQPDGVYVDVTYGGGGHSREILKHLTTGRLIAFDQDEDAAANVIDDKRLLFIRHNFRFFKNFLRYNGITQIDGLIADLGVSSHHFDQPDRGFSFRFDGMLDMRMNRNAKLTTIDVLNNYDDRTLYKIFRDYGEVENSGKLVKAIVDARQISKIETIEQLKQVIEACMPKNREHKYLAKVFQALRIEVNNEMDALKELLLQSSQVVKKDGRLVVITYHSLEDRLVKSFFQKGKFDGEIEKDIYGKSYVPFESINRKVIIPENSELEENSRSRSAKLRIGKRI